MKKIVMNLLLLTISTSFLLIALYPQETKKEIRIKETESSFVKTTETTIYISSEQDHIKIIKQLTENYDMSLISSKLTENGDNLLGDIEIQLSEIAQKMQQCMLLLNLMHLKRLKIRLEGFT